MLMMRALIVICSLFIALSPARTQTVDPFIVRRILVDGRSVPATDQLSWRGPDGSENRRLALDQVIVPGTRIQTGAGVLIEIERMHPVLRIVLEPGTRLTVQQNDPDAVQASVHDGTAGFSLIGRLDFYFSVNSFRKVFAIAKGTRFSIRAEPTCERGGNAGCVSVTLDEGRLDLETRRPVQIGTVPAAQPGPAGQAASSTETTVTITDTMVAGERRDIALEPARFALHFASWAEAERYFAAELERASAGHDLRTLLRALRNEAVILRLGGRNDDSLAVATRGLEQARASGDRVWQFRFLIDQGFAIWQQRRDRSALPLFDAAFAMIDVTDTAAIEPADVAALYGRYGGIRFDARDRAQPGPDLDAAEDYMRRALRLREAETGADAALDQSLSHFGLGMLLRIGREDYAAADQELERAVELRIQALAGRDDLTTAQMLAEAALGKEQLIYQRDSADPRQTAARAAEFDAVGQRFETSLGMLARVFPDRNHRPIGAIARRYGDFNERLGEWWAGRGEPAAAAAKWRFAAARYHDALEVLNRVPGNTSLERRYAYLGLGKARELLNEPAAALDAFRNARALALQEHCAAAPERPSLAWIDDLLGRLALAAEHAGDPAAAEYRRQADAGAVASRCVVVSAPVGPAAMEPQR